jgi:hypothetical protein
LSSQNETLYSHFLHFFCYFVKLEPSGGLMFKFLFLFSVLFALVLGFQNCGSKSFSARTDKTSGLGGEQTLESEEGPQTQEGTDTSTQPPSSGSPQTPKQVDEQIDTMPSNTVNFKNCQSFQELTGSAILVPARTSSEICYYIRLMSARGAAASGSQGEALATDVVARPHYPRPDSNGHPYVLGLKDIMSLQLMGARNVALSSDYRDAQATMFIDNFFLLEQSTEAGSYRAWAYGTADAEPSGEKILINNSFVVNSFYSYASGGTAQVTAIDLTSAVPAGLRMSLRFRALDCGSVANSSDVFMVFH